MDELTQLKAQGIGAALKLITGELPKIDQYPDHYTVYWSKDQQPKVSAFLDSTIDKMTADTKEVNPIQIDLLPVILPVALKRIVPYILAYSALIFFIGNLTGSKKNDYRKRKRSAKNGS